MPKLFVSHGDEMELEMEVGPRLSSDLGEQNLGEQNQNKKQKDIKGFNPPLEVPDFKDYFLLPDRFNGSKTYRPEQGEILQKTLEWLHDPEVDYVIIEAPTGSGKSPVALTLAEMAKDYWGKNSYIITVNKLLQDQYIGDYPSAVTPLKGRENYLCHLKDADGKNFNCKTSPCRKTKESRTECGGCEYKSAKEAAQLAPTTLFNFAAALAFLNFVGFKPRGLLLIDECHNIVSQVTGYAELIFDRDQLRNTGLANSIPDYNDVTSYTSFIKEIAAKIPRKEEDIEEMYEDLAEDVIAIGRKIVTYDMYSPELFVLAKEYEPKLGYLKKIKFTPADVSPILNKVLFGHGRKFVLLSATVLNKDAYIESLGIDPKRVRFIRVGSSFPKENRPIYTYKSVGFLNKDNLDSYLPQLAKVSDELLNMFPNVKGIIHGHTYKICQYLNDNMKNSSRLLFPKSAKEQKLILAQHASSKGPTILLSPSMTEGVDLAGDLAALQIMIKTPYPYLGDPVIKKRMELYPSYYAWCTALTLVQSYGRSIRSKTDKAATYFLDASTLHFIKKNQRLFPTWFLEAIV